MLFSRASRDARVRQMGLMRGKDENQTQLRARLAKLAQGPVQAQEEGKFSRAPSAAEANPVALEKARSKRSIVVASRREGGSFGPRAKGTQGAATDPNIRAHPLWYRGADPEWFVPVHEDRHGKTWCLADAALVMQSGARGFLSRRKRRLGLEAARRVFENVYAIKIQRCWRIARARRARRAAIGNMTESASFVLKRCARGMVERYLWTQEVVKMHVAARQIQRKFRSGRMKLVIKRLLSKRMTKNVEFVQRCWRKYKRWIDWQRAEEERVYVCAKQVKKDFIDGINKNLGPKESKERRKKSLETFLENTNVVGRRNVLRELKRDKLGGFVQVNVKLKDAIHMTTEQVLELSDGRRRDPKHVYLTLKDAFYNKKTSVDLSTNPQREDQEELKISRWPYGLQGDHGMLRLTQLLLSYNNLVGFPLDFYRLTNLTDLRANNNRLKNIAPEISQLHELKIVWVAHNLLTHLPPTISALTKLDQLAVDNNNLTSLPTSLGFLTQMAQMKINDNPLISPPIEITRTITKPPDDWDFSIVLRYLRHLHSAQTPCCDVQGFGINNMPSIINGMGHLRALVLSSNRIQELPKWFYEMTSLTCVCLNDNRIERVAKRVSGMSHLTELSLRRNRLKQNGLPINALVTLTKLEILDLRLNLLLSPPAEVLAQDAQVILRFMQATHAAEMGEDVLDLQNFYLKVFPEPNAHGTIRKLILADNIIRDFPMHILRVSKLDELNLSGNLISSLPSEITQLVNIRKLYLKSNSLTELPKEFSKLEELVDLDVSANQLMTLPESLPRLLNLRRLRVSRNRLKKLPHDLSTMISLWDLRLDYNNLEQLPDSFDGMTELKSLYLDANNLRTLPPSLGKCLQLKDLSVTKNSLAGLVPAVGKLPNLSNFWLSDNCMRNLPKTLGSMMSLTMLDLERNEMDKFVPLDMLKSLEILKLKRNFIKFIPPEIEKLHKLTYFDISENQLVAIAAEVRFLTSLKTLDLSNNQLHSLPPYPPQQGPIFGKMVSLEKLHVRKNLLSNLPLDLWETTTLQELHLQENPWIGNPKLKRVVAPHPEDAGGELVVRVIEGKDFAKMDGRRGLSDPYIKIKLQEAKFQTVVIPGSLNPRWNQTFKFQLDDNPYDDEIECEVFDWDAEGEDDTMGHFTIPLTRELLHKARRRKPGEEAVSDSQREMWVNLQGEDHLGRAAKGQVRFQFEVRSEPPRLAFSKVQPCACISAILSHLVST
jgi:Leucine-rich repeat (LRR) protein